MLRYIVCLLTILLTSFNVYSESLDDLVVKLQTDNNICNWVNKNIWYSLRTEYDRSPQEIYESRKGQCHHFTMLTTYMLQKAGYKAYYISIYKMVKNNSDDCSETDVYGKKTVITNHAITVYEDGAGYWHSVDNGTLHKTKSKTLLDMFKSSIRYSGLLFQTIGISTVNDLNSNSEKFLGLMVVK